MSRFIFHTFVFTILSLSFFSPSFTQNKPAVTLRTQLLYGGLPEGPEKFLAAADSVLRGVRVAPDNGKSPAFAIILSAVAPGVGQIYAERYWTIPLIWGFGYWFTREYLRLDDRYREWKLTYATSLQGGANAGLGDPHAKYVRDFYRDQRDEFAFYLALTYVLNLVDAYVGASLHSFDVSEDLGGAKSVRVEARIPLR